MYTLQQVDNSLDDIAESKGELPAIVADLRAQLDDTKIKIKELNDLIKSLKVGRDAADVEIISWTEKIEKYKNQLLQVKSNKQYDALTREMDSAQEKISSLEKGMEDAEGKMLTAKTDIETFTARLGEITLEYEEKEKELRELSKEHEKEESKLLKERKQITSGIDSIQLQRYEKIRKAKGGKAVVAIRRNACGGCFNAVPPQIILELRKNNRFIACEHCGRILVSDEVVNKNVPVS